MRAAAFALFALAICVVCAPIGRAAEIDDLLVEDDLRPDEIYRKSGAASWGAIFSRLFQDIPAERSYFEKSFALVVGVNQYRGGWKELNMTRNDPVRVRDSLIDQAGFDLVIMLTNERATKDRIRYLMEDVFPTVLDESDRFLFYFSGHGTQRQIARAGTVGYLPLTGSDRIYSRMISMEEVRGWDRLLRPVKQVLFLLDACFSGLAGIQPKSGHPNRTVERLAAYGHHLITAGTGGQETIAGDEWNGSIFTDSFLHAIAGRADTESEFGRDGVVSLAELMEYVGRRVDREAARYGRRITPQIYDLSGDNEGEFFFITEEYQLQGQPQARLETGLPAVVKGIETPQPAAPARPDPAALEAALNLRPEDRRVIQEALTALDFDTRGVDGVFGANTRRAIIGWQSAAGEEPTGYLTSSQYGRLLGEA